MSGDCIIDINQKVSQVNRSYETAVALEIEATI